MAVSPCFGHGGYGGYDLIFQLLSRHFFFGQEGAETEATGRPERWIPLEPVAFLESTWNLVLVLGYTEHLGQNIPSTSTFES